jgi:hypothetical protein
MSTKSFVFGGASLLLCLYMSQWTSAGDAELSLSERALSFPETYKGKFIQVETIVPPSDIDSAPFDTAVLPNGRTVVSGPKSKLLMLENGTLKTTEYPTNGRYFESDKYGRMWYWNCPRGTLYKYESRGEQQIEGDSPNIKFTLKQYINTTYANGALAVDPDGSQVFVGWWRDYKGVSRVYRYDTILKKLQKVYDANGYPDKVHALEVTNVGEVFLARSHDILKYNIPTGWIKYRNLPSGHNVNHDSLTSDSNGNLYYASVGVEKGIFMISPNDREDIKTLVPLTHKIEVPSGLSWNAKENYLTAVRKQKGELIKIHDFSSGTGKITVLNKATGLVRPIAIEEGPRGSIFVNGDEVGLLKITKSGEVSIFKNEICSFQPPAADFTFRNGLIYYSWAAPGFDGQIVTIPNSESYSVVAQEIGTPAGIDLGPENTIYYCNFSANGGVYRLESRGPPTEIISNIPYPVGLVVDGNNHFWVGAAEPNAKPNPNTMNDVLSTRLLHFDSKGKFIGEVINTNKGQFKGGNYEFTFFDVDTWGENIYLPMRNMIFRLDQKGGIINYHEGDYTALRGAKIFSDGYVYFVDYWASALYRIKM